MSTMSEHQTPIAVAVADNDEMAAQAMCLYAGRSHPRTRVVWHTTAVALAVHRCIAAAHPPDVLLLDMALDGISGTEVGARIRAANTHTGIIGVTAYAVEEYLHAAVDAGMQALLAKDTLARTLPPALLAVAEGGVWPEGAPFLPVRAAHERLLSARRDDPFARLSDRERAIMHRYAQGWDTDRIAGDLHISRNSVFTYVRRGCAKLGVRTRGEALALAERLGAFGPADPAPGRRRPRP